MPESQSILPALMAVIAERRDHPPQGRSYVVSLLEGGVPKIAAKMTEEANEIVEAAYETGPGGHAHLVHEVADLIFHTMVLLGHQRIEWQEIESELGRRFGIGGFTEKESRGQPAPSPSDG